MAARTTMLRLLILILALARTGTLSAEGFLQASVVSQESPGYASDLQRAGHTVLELNSEWQVKEATSEVYSPATIPCITHRPGAGFSLRHEFNLPDSLAWIDWELHVPVYRGAMDLLVNGNLLYSGEGNLDDAIVKIPDGLLVSGSINSLLIEFSDHHNLTTSIPKRPGLFQPRGFTGLLSNVYLVGRSGWALTDLSCTYTCDADSGGATGFINLRAAIRVRSGSKAPPDTLYRIFDYSGLRVAFALLDSSNEALGRSELAMADYLLNSHSHPWMIDSLVLSLWSPESARKYELQSLLLHERDTLAILRKSIGFREAGMTATGLILNGRQLEFRCVDYIPTYGITQSVTQELSTIRQLGFNAVRVYDAPLTTPFLIAADSLGVLVLGETGLSARPAKFIGKDLLDHYRQTVAADLLDNSYWHPSLTAISVAELLNFENPTVKQNLVELTQELSARSSIPVGLESVSPLPAEYEIDFVMPHRPAYSADLPDWQQSAPPAIFTNLGWFAEDGQSADSAASILSYQMSEARAADSYAGFVFHSYNDYLGAEPLLGMNSPSIPQLYQTGLINVHGDVKEIVHSASAVIRDPSAKTSSFRPVQAADRSMLFAIAALSALLVLSISIRSNNVFRQNLRRVFRHSHGFFSDIRYRRYLPASQSLLLWLLNGFAIALVIVSYAHWARRSIQLDYLLTFIGLSGNTKAGLIPLVHNPVHALIVVYILVLLLGCLHTLFLKLISKLFRPRVSLGQLWNYLNWSAAPLLYLLPIAAILYRLLHFDAMIIPATVLCAFFLLWAGLRLMNALVNGFQSNLLVVGLLFIVITGGVTAGLYLAINSWFHFGAYWQWLTSVYS